MFAQALRQAALPVPKKSCVDASRAILTMCEVKLSICVHCGKIFGAKMQYCDPVQDTMSVADSSPFEITSSFNWSPMEGCSGLQIHHTANLDACRNDLSRTEAPPFERPTAARPSARSPYPTPMTIQRTEIREQLPPLAGMEEHRGAAMMPLGSDLQTQMQLQIQMQTEPSTGDTPTAGSPSSSWSGSTVSYY
ncbi:hypothetical protein ACHAQJ_008828 [Trichoderma viride]